MCNIDCCLIINQIYPSPVRENLVIVNLGGNLRTLNPNKFNFINITQPDF